MYLLHNTTNGQESCGFDFKATAPENCSIYKCLLHITKYCFQLQSSRDAIKKGVQVDYTRKNKRKEKWDNDAAPEYHLEKKSRTSTTKSKRGRPKNSPNINRSGFFFQVLQRNQCWIDSTIFAMFSIFQHLPDQFENGIVLDADLSKNSGVLMLVRLHQVFQETLENTKTWNKEIRVVHDYCWEISVVQKGYRVLVHERL
jgi:hypothetical protein